MIIMKYTEEDIGTILDIDADNGSSYDERIVLVYCRVCSSRFIGPIKDAGGFLARHEFFHTWEFKMEMQTELEA